MKQQRFKFGCERPTLKSEGWAEIVAADPARYPSPAMQRCALLALHRAGKPHDGRGCPLCQQESAA
jgi:hypothetical protein